MSGRQSKHKQFDSFFTTAFLICLVAISSGVFAFYELRFGKGGGISDIKSIILLGNANLLLLMTLFFVKVRSRIRKIYSVFISYSTKDKKIARRLCTDLQENGIRCWFAPEHLRIGDRFWQRILESIFDSDKVLLILSEDSVNSGWVQREVEATVSRGAGILFPIRIDDSVFKTKAKWARRILEEIYIGDFTQCEDTGEYRRSLNRLVQDMRAVH